MPEVSLEEAGEISKDQYFCNLNLHACRIGSTPDKHTRNDRGKEVMREGDMSDMEAPLFRNGPHHFSMRQDEQTSIDERETLRRGIIISRKA
jgi:hypothetical protein